MALTKRQRSAINSANASKATGPKTAGGKARSSRNALKHGLRADALALPNEDPALIQARCDEWFRHYNPKSPAAIHLINVCVQATFLSDRVGRFHHSAISRQIRKALHELTLAHEVRLDTCIENLPKDPERTIRDLTSFGTGVRWLIEQWETLDKTLDKRGGWTVAECDFANRLQGFRAELNTLSKCPPAWLTCFFGLLAVHEKPEIEALHALLMPRHIPACYRDDYSLEEVPAIQTCHDSLKKMVAEKLNYLRILEADFSECLDQRDLEDAKARALVIQDGPTARLFLRYHSEARNAFNRALAQLMKVLELDAAAGLYDEEETVDEEPLPTVVDEEIVAEEPPPTVVEPAPEVASPNEPNYDASPLTGEEKLFAELVADLTAMGADSEEEAALLHEMNEVVRTRSYYGKKRPALMAS